MEHNPYQSPQLSEHPSSAIQAVAWPATGLLAVATICIAFAVLSIAMDIFLLASGLVEIVREKTGNNEVMYAVFRMSWAATLLGCSAFIIYGALQMRRLKGYTLSFSAALLAAIPCLGPCCLLGIPFGVWAIVILRRPDVRSTFRS